LSRYRKINLNASNVFVANLGNIALLAGDVNGDVNGDGIIDAKDVTALTSYGKNYGDSGYLIDADLNGDKTINSDDFALLTPNLNKNSNVYNENVNVITVNAAADGSVMTVGGTAAPNSTVECTVKINGIIMYRESLICNSSGVYTGYCNISKRGAYNIAVTSEDRAFDVVADYYYN
jgi:hypothetical protein